MIAITIAIPTYIAETRASGVPKKPAKSSDFVTPLSLMTTYQKDRNRTMKVLALELMMPSDVAAAATNTMPMSSAGRATAWAIAVRMIGTARRMLGTRIDDAIFQTTNLSRTFGGA